MRLSFMCQKKVSRISCGGSHANFSLLQTLAYDAFLLNKHDTLMAKQKTLSSMPEAVIMFMKKAINNCSAIGGGTAIKQVSFAGEDVTTVRKVSGSKRKGRKLQVPQ